MSMIRAMRRKSVLVAAVAAAVSTWTQVAPAATVTWNGGGANNNWDTPANWAGGAIPVANDALVFDGTVRLAPSNNLTANTVFTGLTFNAGAGAFTLGGNAITLGPAGNIVNNSLNTQIVNLPLTLAAGRHAITTTGASSLNLGGAITRSAGSTVLFTRGTGNINVTGTGLANTHGILGGYATTGGDWAALDGGGNVVAYTGYTDLDTTVATPVIVSGPAQNLRIPTAGNNVAMAATGTTDINTLLFSGTATQVIDIGAGNILRFGARGGIYRTNNSTALPLNIGAAANTGTITAGGADGTPGEIVLNAAPSGGSQVININANIADNGAGNAVTLIKAGGASMSLNSTGNTYTGGTHIVEGRIALAGGAIDPFGTGAVHVYPGGNIFGSSATHSNAFFVNSLGWVPSTGGTEAGIGALRGGTYSGTVTMTGDSGFSGNTRIDGKLTGNFNALFGATTTIASTPSISNPLNDYTGNTTVVSRTNGASTTTFTLNASEVIPHGSGKGNLIIGNTGQNAASTVTLNLNGQSETVNALISAGNAALAFIQNNSATPATLIVGANDASGAYAGRINDNTGTVAFTKIGSGQQTLSGSNGYTGATNVNGGALLVTGTLAGGGAVNVNTADASTTLAGTANMGHVTLAADTGANKATLAPGTGPATIGTMTLSSLTVNGGQLQFDLGAPTVNDHVSAGAVNFAGASTIALTGGVVGQQYLLINSGGAIGYPATPTIAPPTGGSLTRPTSYTLDTTTVPSQLLVDVTGGGAIPLTWTGAAANNDWDINSTVNWKNAADAPEVFFNLDTVTFGNGPADRNVNITTNVLPGAVAVDNDAVNDYTFSGTGGIGGSGTLTKLGAGTLTLLTSNTHTGATDVQAGTLAVGNGGTTGSLGAGSVNVSGALVFNRSDAVTVTNVISGGGTITKNGAGQLTLSGANQNSGMITVNAGTLRMGAATALGNAPATINSGTTLVANGTLSSSNAITVSNATLAASSAAAPTIPGDVTFTTGTTSTILATDPTLTGNRDSIEYMFTGNVHGGGSVNIVAAPDISADQGSGVRFRGTGAASYSGTVTVGNNVKAEIQTSQSGPYSPLGTGKIILTAGDVALGNTLNAATTTGGHSILNLRNNSTGNTRFGNDIEIAGTGLAMLNPIGSAPADALTEMGNLKVGGGQQVGLYRASGNNSIVSFDTVTLTGGTVTFSPKVNGFGAATSTGSDLRLGNISQTAPTNIVMNGLRVLILNGSSNNYSGTTTVSSGTLRITGTGGLGTTGHVTNDAALQVHSNNALGNVGGAGATTIGDGVTAVTVSANHFRQSALTVGNGSTAVVNADSTANGVSVVNNVTLGTGSKIDLKDNKLITLNAAGTATEGVYDGLQGQVQTAYNFGSWDGPGLTTSMPDALAGIGTVGVATGEQIRGLGPTDTDVWAGQTISGASTIAMYTYAGDANLDGQVDAGDYGILDAFIQIEGATGYGNGDFNYDGFIDPADYGTIDNSIQFQGPPIFTSGGSGGAVAGLSGVTAVPEPTACGLALFAAATLIGRRRRRRIAADGTTV